MLDFLPSVKRVESHLTAPERPRDTEIVDHSTVIRRACFLLGLDDFLNDGIEAAMAFKGLPIGISDSLAEHDGFLLGLGDGPPAPGCEHTAGAVEALVRDLARLEEHPAPALYR